MSPRCCAFFALLWGWCFVAAHTRKRYYTKPNLVCQGDLALFQGNFAAVLALCFLPRALFQGAWKLYETIHRLSRRFCTLSGSYEIELGTLSELLGRVQFLLPPTSLRKTRGLL